ncbi:MAG: cytochrome b/b6 domain-containing protein [Rubellimicrobium sp.]|nr:cytochrome b/b6 domain-containing protein [Rubellimicrobium sp.]
MPPTPTQTAYSLPQMTLHWLTVLLIAGVWLTRESAERAFDAAQEGGAAGLPLHSWLGIAVLVLTLARIALRRTHGAPPPPATDTPMQQKATVWGHRILYLLLIFVPIGGSVMWFSGQDMPHGLLGNLLLILILGHTALALYHHYVKRDGLMNRMTRPGS